MPYQRNDQLPKGVKHALPGHGQAIFRNVVNSALSRGASDESAHRQAWAAVGRNYKRPEGGGRWSRRGASKAGPGALAYPNWQTQSQKMDGEDDGDEDMMKLARVGLLKYNPNHDERGRFSEGPGGNAVQAAVANSGKTKKPKTSIKNLQAAFKSARAQRQRVANSIKSLQSRIKQYKRNTDAYRRAQMRLNDLRARRVELTREMGRLGSEIVRRKGPGYQMDWLQSFGAGFPVWHRVPTRKSAGDLFEIRPVFGA